MWQYNSTQREFTNLSSLCTLPGIPVKSVVLSRQSPVEIEVVLSGSENADQSGQDDLW
jgi:hypothetical protein